MADLRGGFRYQEIGRYKHSPLHDIYRIGLTAVHPREDLWQGGSGDGNRPERSIDHLALPLGWEFFERLISKAGEQSLPTHKKQLVPSSSSGCTQSWDVTLPRKAHDEL